MRNTIIAVLAALALLLAFATPAMAHGGIDRKTNRFRVRHELRRLPTNDHLVSLARQRARQIYRWGFYHDFGWVNDTRCRMGGENIAYRVPALNREDRAWWFYTAWRDSLPHRRNMLGDRWNRMASAIYIAPNGGMYGVQLFCDR